MKEDWTEKLKQKLEGHQKTPPPGLWEGISQQIGLAAPVRQKTEQNSPSRSLSPFIKRWYWAVAAAVLALVGFFTFHEDNSIKQQPMQAEKVSQPSTPQQVATTHVAMDEPASRKPLLAFAQSRKPHYEEKENDYPIHPEPTMPDGKTETDIPSIDEQESLPTSPKKEESDKPIHRQPTHQEPPSVHPSPSRKWSVGVNASSGILAVQNSQRTDRLYYNNFSDVGNGSTNGTYSPYTMTDYVTEHHLPIRIGLNLHFQLAPRIALLSGVNYTYLFSRVSIPLYRTVVTKQELHYLGIPFGISYQLWSTSHFQFYVSGNTMVEKCLNEKPWQWSVNATAGAEYTPTRQIGFYIQPSIGYYFDDGTSFEHYYKKHPLAPSLEFGVRLHLQSHNP